MISPSQRPLPDNTQQSQHTNIQALGGIRTHDRSRRAAVDLRLRPRGHWDRQFMLFQCNKLLPVNCFRIPFGPHFRMWRIYFLLLLFQSALQPLWIMACSTIVEYSQQEGFYRVPLPAARQTPNLEDQWLECSNSRQAGVPQVWNDPSESQQREFCRKWRLPLHFWVILHAVKLRHGTDGFTSPPKEGVLRIFFARKIRRLRPGLKPRTWVQEASTLTSRPPKPLCERYIPIFIVWKWKGTQELIRVAESSTNLILDIPPCYINGIK